MAAENRDFGRFVTNWYSVHCKHTRFFKFLGLLNEGFSKKLGFGGLGLGLGVAKVRLPAHWYQSQNQRLWYLAPSEVTVWKAVFDWEHCVIFILVA